jgi:hypothetical protein
LSHYLDPRLTIAFAKKHGVAVSSLIPKHLLYHFHENSSNKRV